MTRHGLNLRPSGRRARQTDDGDRLFAELRAEGVTVLRDPAGMPRGGRVAAADPDGNPVTLARPPCRRRRHLRVCGG